MEQHGRARGSCDQDEKSRFQSAGSPAVRGGPVGEPALLRGGDGRQDEENWIRANEEPLKYFGGSAQALIPDNIAAAANRPDCYEQGIDPVFDDFTWHCGLVILTTRVHRPLDKVLVEIQSLVSVDRVEPREGVQQANEPRYATYCEIRRRIEGFDLGVNSQAVYWQAFAQMSIVLCSDL